MFPANSHQVTCPQCPRILEIFAIEGDFAAAFRAYSCDPVAVGCARFRRFSQAPVFPLLDLDGSSSVTLALATREDTR
eukprot:725810-Amphidinium_carterae.1